MLNISQNLLLDTLRTFSVSCLRSKTRKEIAVSVQQLLNEVMKTEFTSLYLFNLETLKLELLLAQGFSEEERILAEETAMERHPGQVFTTGEMLYLPDVEDDQAHINVEGPGSIKVRSRLYLPVRTESICIGAFGVISTEPNRFDETDISLLKFLCSQAGEAFSRIMEEEQQQIVLRQLELRNRAINASKNGIIITDPTLNDNPVIYANSAFENMTGYSTEEVLGKNCRFLQGENTNQPGLTILRDALKNKTGCTVILENRKKDNTLFFTELSITPVFGVNNQIVNYVGIQNDVTKRIKTEESLKLITSRVSQLIQSLPSGILLEDEHRKMILLNDEFRQMFGIQEKIEDLIGSDCSELSEFSKDMFKDEEAFNSTITAALSKRKPRKNEELLLKDGRIFERDYIPIVIDNNYRGHLWNYRDITKRKLVEQQVSDLKHFYEQTLNDLPGQIAVFDSNFRYLYLNPSSVRNAELRLWMIGKDDFEFCAYRGIDRSVAERRRENFHNVKSRREAIRFEEELIKSDGSVYYFERVISPMLDDKGEIKQYLAYGVDITEIKSLIKNLEYTNKSLTEFAYIASHDLREPLRKITAFGSLLQKTLKNKLTEDEKENFDYMIDGAGRMQQMVDDLLLYSRVSSRPKDLKDIDISMVIQEIINFNLAEAIAEKNALIRINGSAGIIRGEDLHFRQLIQNLLGNGIKYCAGNTQPQIEITCKREVKFLTLSFKDNGIGIPYEHHTQIFEMFKRLHGKGEFSGNGIGLAVCKKIVENYSGTITVHSEVNKGSEFIVTLPIKEHK